MAVDPQRAPIRKRRWGELDEDDGEDLAYLLPPPMVGGPDQNEPRAPGSKQEEPLAAGDPLASLGGKAGAVLVCRTCGKKGDHWTSKCPYRDLATQNQGFMDKPPTTETAAGGASATGSKGAYLPPSMRAGVVEFDSGPHNRPRNDVNSVRVTNLSEDTREADLHELFRSFGPVTRVYVAVHPKTGMSRGFGFVMFVSREDAERAINKLNGYDYHNLILRVDWVTPTPK